MQVVQLDALAFEFTPAQIAVLFNVQAQEVRDHCRDLWGIQGNRWSLEFDQAAVVIYRMARSPRKVKPERVLEKLQTRGLNNSVILSHELVARARQAIQDDREERRKAQLTIKQRSGSA